MKSKSFPHFSFARSLLLGNACLWLILRVFFVLKSYPYIPHKPIFEERSPELIYFGRALSYLENEKMIPLIRTIRLVQLPSFYAASPFNLLFSRRGMAVDQLYWGISVGGYYLLLVCLLSFVQWYLVGVLIDYIRPFLGE
jgi:hypothetical protein